MSSPAAVKSSGAGGGLKAKPGAGKEDAGGKGKDIASSEGRKKVADGSTKSVSVANQKSVAMAAKPEGKTASSSKAFTKTSSKAATKGKSEKKDYSFIGQKYDTPEEREPLRIFYETLSKQIPSSEMAEIWMMEHGLLSPERAKKANERKQKKQQLLRTGTPIETPKLERPESSTKSHVSKNGDIKAKRRVDYSDDNDDFNVKPKKIKA